MSPVIVALDVPTLDRAESLARSLASEVGGFKVGMELLMGEGPRAIATIADIGLPIFADAKLHDIPNTVRGAASRIRAAGARWVTVHAAGGPAMVEAAVEAMEGQGVLGVTMLTSLGPSDLPGIGVGQPVAEYVAILAGVAGEAGCEGAVCSPAEIGVVRRAAPGLHVFTPGVRPASADSGDQKRVATPESAISDGADYIVVGRPVTAAVDPVSAAREIAASIATIVSSPGAMVDVSRPQT